MKQAKNLIFLILRNLDYFVKYVSHI